MGPACCRRAVGWLGALLLLVSPLSAWNGHEVTEHGIRLAVAEIADVVAPELPTEVRVTLENLGGAAQAGRLEVVDLVDAWRVVGDAQVPFQVGPGERIEARFQIASGRPVYAALYPVHVQARWRVDGEARTVRAVRIFRVTTARPKRETVATPPPAALTLAADGALALVRARAFRVGWQYYDQETVWMPPGWTGSDPQSRASVSRGPATRGTPRPALSMHPPWHPGGGTVWCDYPVALPAAGPIRLRFATAIRDHTAAEPGSDGVLFRVWVLAGEAVAAPQFERFSASKVWEEGEVDLSPWAGQTVTLRLESHPGPQRDTHCDACFWADPVLAAGAALADPGIMEEAPAAVLVTQAQAVAAGSAEPDGRQTFRLEGALGGPFGVVVQPGPMGLLDGWFVFAGRSGRAAAFRGLDIELEDEPVGRAPASLVFREVERRDGREGVTYRHRFDAGEVRADLRAEGPGLRVKVSSDRRLSRLGPQAWNQAAQRVFWGHGYVVEAPEAFRQSFGGHGLAASHVGFDFGDVTVLQASDTPPSHLEVDPARRRQGLYTRMDSLLTFVPARQALAAAIAYRPLYDKGPAAGVGRLAGRFCFDIWGGSYGQIAERLEEAVRYGLTDSFLTIHNWQRWGYDYRLPDIWPPNPALGGLDDLRRVGAICRAADMPWGFHDNYIDFYPDAEDYSYEHIAFTRDGRPRPAWHNRGREAYSYTWRPDRILPFVKRNTRWLRDGLAPTHSFLDVFTSSGCLEWWDDEGRFHSALETRRHWGEAFAWIRDCLGGQAPTTSEAGHDQLIGYLDGADCQWLTLSPTGGEHLIRLPCADWERVPWYDAVNHANFILHGVGYSIRYQGPRSRELHGISSDDYLSAEVLSGHALMVDSGCWGRAAVRKYYLLQDLARRLAGRQVVAAEFVEGDSHRQRLVWDEGTEVFVNRGAEPWVVSGHVLPRYGFLARRGDDYVAVEMLGGHYAESSRGESGWFCNARNSGPERQRRVYAQPRVSGFADLGGGRFRYDLEWEVRQACPATWHTFVHFMQPAEGMREIVFQDDHAPSLPTSAWVPGQVKTPRTLSIPATAQGAYPVLVGLFSQDLGRAQIDGPPAGEERVLVGTLEVRRDAGGAVTLGFAPSPAAAPESELPPVNPAGTPVDFGFAATDGACRIQAVPAGLRVTPLPGGEPGEITLRLIPLGCGERGPLREAVAIAPDPASPAAPVTVQESATEVQIRHTPGTFAYELRW